MRILQIRPCNPNGIIGSPGSRGCAEAIHRWRSCILLKYCAARCAHIASYIGSPEFNRMCSIRIGTKRQGDAVARKYARCIHPRPVVDRIFNPRKPRMGFEYSVPCQQGILCIGPAGRIDADRRFCWRCSVDFERCAKRRPFVAVPVPAAEINTMFTIAEGGDVKRKAARCRCFAG